MSSKKNIYGIFWLVVILVLGSFSLLASGESESRAVDYTIDLTDPSSDAESLGATNTMLDNADIIGLKSSESTGTITLELTITGTIPDTVEGDMEIFWYDFYIDIDSDGYEDWWIYVSMDSYYGLESEMTDLDSSYDLTEYASGGGTDTLKVEFPLSYITGEIIGWDIYAESSVQDYSYTIDDWIEAYDYAPDDGFSVDASADEDNDGMDDWWENLYGLNSSDGNDANLDPDSDGYSNIEEHDYGSDPLDGTDHPPTQNTGIVVTITNPTDSELISSSDDYDEYYKPTGTVTPPAGETIDYVEWKLYDDYFDEYWNWGSCYDTSLSGDWSSWEAYLSIYSYYGDLLTGENTMEVWAVTENSEYNYASVNFTYETTDSWGYEDYFDWNFTFSGNKVKLTCNYEELWYEGTFKIDTEQDPKEIDITLTSNSDDASFNGLTMLGIYDLYDDFLEISLHDPGYPVRPTTFYYTGENYDFILIKTGGGSGATELEGTWLGYEDYEYDDYSWDYDYWDITFKGNNFNLSYPYYDAWLEGTFTIDTSKDPKHIDITVTSNNIGPEYNDVTTLGIYYLEDDYLELNLPDTADSRPTTFDYTGSNSILVMYQVGGGSGGTELEGTWSGYEFFDYYEWKFEFSGNEITVYCLYWDEWYDGTFTLDTSTDPKQLDITITDNNVDYELNGESIHCIYKVSDDSLRISMHEPGDPTRPTSFDYTGDNLIIGMTKSSSSEGAGELEGIWLGYEYYDYDYEWDDYYAPIPSTETPTDTSIKIEITSALFSWKEEGDYVTYEVLVTGTTNGVDHCELTFLSYYIDGSYDDYVYWEEEFDYSITDEASDYLEDWGYTITACHFKALTPEWKTWEYNLYISMPKFEDDFSVGGPEFSSYMPMLDVFVRAFRDANESYWNQDYHAVDLEINGVLLSSEITVEFASGYGEVDVDYLEWDYLEKDYNISYSTFEDDEFEYIEAFIQIQISETDDWEWLVIECEYDPDKLPANINEDNIVLYYFDASQFKWIRCEDTWVDKDANKVYANLTHLTIFAPMAESGGSGDGDGDGDGGSSPVGGMSIMVILSLIAVVFVIAIAAGVIIVRKRRTPRPPGEAPPSDEKSGEPDKDIKEKEMVEEGNIEWGEDEDEEDVDLSELKVVTKKCPACKTSIKVKPVFEEKVQIKCSECGKKGKIPNPYLDEIEELRRAARATPPPPPEVEFDEPDPKEIDCRKCGEPLTVPYSDTDEKVSVECTECGARGKIPNPYLEKGDSKPRKDSKPPGEKDKSFEDELFSFDEDEDGKKKDDDMEFDMDF